MKTCLYGNKSGFENIYYNIFEILDNMIIALLTLDLDLTLTSAFKIRQPRLKSVCVVLRYNCAKCGALLQRVTIIPLIKQIH